jgi:tetratricopeptide (TPR) repeat protein
LNRAVERYHAYKRLGTILAHIGLLDRAREMYERARPFHPNRKVSPSIVQVYIWSHQQEPAREYIAAWRSENPTNKYAIYFTPLPAMMTGHWEEAETLLDEALRLVPNDPLVISLQGVFYGLTGRVDAALNCMTLACSNPKSFGHAHHTYYQSLHPGDGGATRDSFSVAGAKRQHRLRLLALFLEGSLPGITAWLSGI